MESELTLEKKSTGGRGYFLPAGEIYNAAENGNIRVMNIDFIDPSDPEAEEHGTTFTILETTINGQSVDVLSDMNIDGVKVPTSIRNFTYSPSWFSRVQADKDIWLNRENNM